MAKDSEQRQVSPANPGYSKEAPQFDQFPVPTKQKGERHWLSLGRCDQAFGPIAGYGHRLVRNRAKAQGPIFAGHYGIVVCSCGAECGGVSIVDVQSGRVYNFEHMSQACASAFESYRDFLYFRVDSSLLILIGSPPDWKNGAEDYKGCAVRYYRWTGRRLVLLKEVPMRNNAA
jgi:hypothetical protein